jgi:hypothetical protein
MGNFMPLMLNNTIAKPVPGTSTASTQSPVGHVPGTYEHEIPTSLFQQTNNTPSLGSQPYDQNCRPKRRRKPQKPGKTAKQNDRHFVVHNYHDHALDPDENDVIHEEDNGARRRGGVALSFPSKLHSILDQVEADGLGHVISWQPHGRCFVIHKPKEFSDHVMPHYFRQSKLTSFQRQLNLYGFCRLTRGRDSGGYYHELFLRGKISLARKMQRTKIKGTKFKAASNPDQEPNFYAMPPVGPQFSQPPMVSDDSSADESHFAPTMMGAMSQLSQAADSTYDPLPVNVHHNLVMPNSTRYPLLASDSGYAVNNQMSNSIPLSPMNLGTGLTRADADDILDEAVDELFRENVATPNKEADPFDEFWDETNFGEESYQDDLQLGFMLEKLLDE